MKDPKLGSSVREVSLGVEPAPTYTVYTYPTEHGTGSSTNEAAPLPMETWWQHPVPTWKRAMDILGSVLGLVLLSPLFLATGLLIKSVSKGPVFFRQERVGYMGKTFRLWKFRTYEHNADTTQHENYVSNLISAAHQEKDDPGQPMKKLDNAPDLIPFANVLRKTCVDELPQLINVLLGEMSLVGPRPALAYEVKQYAHWHRKRLYAVPGMTGLWQVSGKNRLTFNEMVRLDIEYARNKSFWSDIRILLKTPLAIVSQIVDSLQKIRSGTASQEQCQAVAQGA